MPVKLVLCDTDGTVLPFGQKHVSRRTREAMRALVAAGITCGMATGREPWDVDEVFEGDPIGTRTGDFANGKLVKLEGEVVLRRTLDKASLARLARFAYTQPDCGLVMQGDPTPGEPHGHRVLLGATPEEAERMRTSEGGHVGVQLVDRLPEGDVVNAGFLCPDDPVRVRRLRAMLAQEVPDLAFVSPAPGFFDVLPAGCDKGTGFLELVRHMGIERDEVVFFGDSENDLALMCLVPNSVCVANGTLQAREAARWHIGPVYQDAVAEAMEQIAATGELPFER